MIVRNKQLDSKNKWGEKSYPSMKKSMDDLAYHLGKAKQILSDLLKKNIQENNQLRMKLEKIIKRRALIFDEIDKKVPIFDIKQTSPYSNHETCIKVGELSIYLERYEVRHKDKLIPLTATEFKILTTLAKKPGWVFRRVQIVEHVRGDRCVVTDRSVDFHIVKLRKKLAKFSDYIETVKGIGYRLKDFD